MDLEELAKYLNSIEILPEDIEEIERCAAEEAFGWVIQKIITELRSDRENETLLRLLKEVRYARANCVYQIDDEAAGDPGTEPTKVGNVWEGRINE